MARWELGGVREFFCNVWEGSGGGVAEELGVTGGTWGGSNSRSPKHMFAFPISSASVGSLPNHAEEFKITPKSN
jgi:hypothetical protein